MNTRTLVPRSNAREDARQQPASGEPTEAPKHCRLALFFVTVPQTVARRELVRPIALVLVAMLLGHDITFFAYSATTSARDVLNIIADLVLVLVIGQPLTEVAQMRLAAPLVIAAAATGIVAAWALARVNRDIDAAFAFGDVPFLNEGMKVATRFGQAGSGRLGQRPSVTNTLTQQTNSPFALGMGPFR